LRNRASAHAAWRRRDPVVAAGLLAITWIQQLVQNGTGHLAAFLALSLVFTLPLALRTRRALTATAVAAAALVAGRVLLGDFTPASEYTAPLLYSYSCGAQARTRPGLTATIALLAALQIAVGFAEAPNPELLVSTLPFWWIGREVRRRRDLVAALATRTGELAAEEESFAELSVRHERTRIARDLHDIVSHHLAVIVIHAGGGRLAGPGPPSAATDRYTTIRDAGVEALAEMSRLVDMLTTETTPAAPRLSSLLAQAQTNGARVSCTPTELELAPAIEGDTYRVVQEGLTNAIKHAPGAPIHIRIDLTSDTVDIQITTGPPSEASPLARSGSGLGLHGLRERTEARQGSLKAGPQPDGGWRVHAQLPT
jgi:signal transduction histidine kinase